MLTVARCAKMIDHSLLRPELCIDDVRVGCALAIRYDVASVSVRPCDVALAAAETSGSTVVVGTVIGFPHGGTTPQTKVTEAGIALADGARELDMMVNVGRLRSGDDGAVAAEVGATVEVATEHGVAVKVILETAYLSDEEKVRACRLAESAGARFVKTSTGFAPSGATVADVRLMRANVSDRVEVKAAGGIRSLDALLALAGAGATRFGTSATAAILDELARRGAPGGPE